MTKDMGLYDLRAAVRRLTAAAAFLACALAGFAQAHDIPSDVKIEAFLKPAATQLEFLIRVPMSGLQDVDFPRRGPGYLDISRADDALRDATKLWLTDNITVYENGERLPTPRTVFARVSLPSDRSFASYEQALAHLQGPKLADDLDLYWNQQFLDVLLEYPIKSDTAQFAIHPRVDRLAQRVTTALRFMPPNGATRPFEFHGDPGFIRLAPRWHEAAWQFVAYGFVQILQALDQLLFLVCLVLPFRQLRPLVIIVASFVVAQLIGLIASALNFVPDALWFPPLIGTLIAAAVVYMAIENIVGAALGDNAAGNAVPRRWITAFAFGIVYGLGLSFTLRELLQFAGDHLLTALFAFNVGIAAGECLVLVVLIGVAGMLFRYVVPAWLGIIIVSALVGHTGWHWMIERGGELAKFPLPAIDAAFLASAMRGMMGVLILVGFVVLANGLIRRWIEGDGQPPANAAARAPLGERG